MTSLQMIEIERMWSDGRSGTEIAGAVGLPDYSVYNYARRHRDRCAARGTGNRNALSDGEARRMVAAAKSGTPFKALAVRYGISERTVQRYVRRARERLSAERGSS